MSYSWPFFNSHGHMFLNSTGRRRAMKQARRKTITYLESYLPFSSEPLLAPQLFFHYFLILLPLFFASFSNSQFYLCRCQYCQQDLFLVLVKAAVSLCTLHEYQFTHNLHWDFSPPKRHWHRRLKRHLLTGSINFCDLQNPGPPNAPKSHKLLHISSTFITLQSVPHTSLYISGI